MNTMTDAAGKVQGLGVLPGGTCSSAHQGTIAGGERTGYH